MVRQPGATPTGPSPPLGEKAGPGEFPDAAGAAISGTRRLDLQESGRQSRKGYRPTPTIRRLYSSQRNYAAPTPAHRPQRS